MNIFVRFGQWLESRRVVRRPELINELREWNGRIVCACSESAGRLIERIVKLESEKQIPATLAKDLSIIRQRLDKMELYVGLKREQGPVSVPGASRIS